MAKVIFLDRDGVVNEFPGNGKYVTTLKGFRFVDGSLEAIRDLTDAGYHIFIVSNQAGVGKGVYSKTKLDLIHKRMMEAVKASGGRIRKAYYCIHRSDAGCSCRKPKIGSVDRALRLVNKDLDHARTAYFIGDTESDIQAGINAGCKTVFVLSGREDRRHMRGWKIRPDYIAKNLRQAVSEIVLAKRPNPKLCYKKTAGVR